MTEIQRDEVQELISRYAWAYDVNDKAELAAVFAVDAEYAVSLSDGTLYATLSGREAILEFVAGTRDSQPDQRRHVMTNLFTLARTDEMVTVRAYLLLVSNGASLDEPFTALGTGVYELDVVRQGGELCFQRFVLVLDRPF
ncbi:MAG TPA: nuclear transport factor 2 family protein [Solirubrobacteraceae bacterium]|jgi:3-phenylpropionate/cinnamic acid dioxygenase small subunit|nr:nuclear transport factor 2 family protein [Solirubrobacteraceae bacterium]